MAHARKPRGRLMFADTSKFATTSPAPKFSTQVVKPTFKSTRRFSLSSTVGTFLGRLQGLFGITAAEAVVQAVGDPETLPQFREIVEPIIQRGREAIGQEARKGALPIVLVVGAGVVALIGAIVFAGRRPATARG